MLNKNNKKVVSSFNNPSSKYHVCANCGNKAVVKTNFGLQIAFGGFFVGGACIWLSFLIIPIIGVIAGMLTGFGGLIYSLFTKKKVCKCKACKAAWTEDKDGNVL